MKLPKRDKVYRPEGRSGARAKGTASGHGGDVTKPYVYGESKLKTRPVVDSPRPPVKKLDLVITSIQDVQDMLTGDMPETAGEAAA